MQDISIIIPVYNTEKYLHRCIDSILQERRVGIELILIDDGSTDESFSICKKYQEKDNRIIILKKRNEGQGIARNLGISISNAKYLYFIDSDDYLYPDAIFTLFMEAQKYNLDICAPDIPSYYYSKNFEYISCFPTRAQFIKSEIIKKYEITQPDVRSGQDGVFSHLALTVTDAFAVNKNAKVHYTSAREGSTFLTYSKRHDAALEIIKGHYSHIFNFYDKWNLWKTNSLRLAHFFEDETLKNRVLPHFKYLAIEQQTNMFRYLSKIVNMIVKNLNKEEQRSLSDLTMKFVDNNKDIFILLEDANNFSKKSITLKKTKNDDGTIICTLSSDRYRFNKLDRAAKEISVIDNFNIKSISSKIDFCINTINNKFIENSFVHFKRPLKKNNIIVSITTMPNRINSAHKAIESIFLQTVLPAKIILYITDNIDLYEIITPELKDQSKRGLTIEQVKDIGPHTKLIYSLQCFQDEIIITCDDDVIYPNTMLQYLLNTHKSFPNSVICNWARELIFDDDGVISPVRKGKLLTPPHLEKNTESNYFSPTESLTSFPYGSGGVLYPPYSLSEEVFNLRMMRKLCPTEDDIWFKAMSLLKKTTVVPTNLGYNPKHHVVSGSQHVALRHINHDMDKQHKQLKDTFAYYDLYSIF